METAPNIFDIGAADYDRWFDSPEGKILFGNELAAIKLLWRNEWHPALEVGVGTGRFAQVLGIEYGLDPAAGVLRLSATRGIRVTQGTGESLPWDDGAFVGVLMVATLCFVDNPLAALREAARVLRQDGRLLVAEIPADSPWGRLLNRKKAEGNPYYWRARTRTTAQWLSLIADAGLEAEAMSSTLRQSPEGPFLVEAPVLKRTEEAGFVCILARLRRELMRPARKSNVLA